MTQLPAGCRRTFRSGADQRASVPHQRAPKPKEPNRRRHSRGNEPREQSPSSLRHGRCTECVCGIGLIATVSDAIAIGSVVAVCYHLPVRNLPHRLILSSAAVDQPFLHVGQYAGCCCHGRITRSALSAVSSSMQEMGHLPCMFCSRFTLVLH